jgi:hypothetical protein
MMWTAELVQPMLAVSLWGDRWLLNIPGTDVHSCLVLRGVRINAYGVRVVAPEVLRLLRQQRELRSPRQKRFPVVT